MYIGHIVEDTDAEGPGRRFAVWTRGCSLRCPGCCNPELFEATGPQTPVSELLEHVSRVEGIEGVSILGGEPTEQEDLEAFCAGVQALGLTVMLYSGHAIEDLRDRQPTLLRHVDLLVDGLYEANQRSNRRRWIGSDNQRLHHLTTAYSTDDPRFQDAQTVEIRWVDGDLIVNGWPDGAKRFRR